MRDTKKLVCTAVATGIMLAAACNPFYFEHPFPWMPTGAYCGVHGFPPGTVFSSPLFEKYADRFESLRGARERWRGLAAEMGAKLVDFQSIATFFPLDDGPQAIWIRAETNFRDVGLEAISRQLERRFGGVNLEEHQIKEKLTKDMQCWVADNGSGLVHDRRGGWLLCNPEAMAAVEKVLRGERAAVSYDHIRAWDQLTATFLGTAPNWRVQEEWSCWDNLEPLVSAYRARTAPLLDNPETLERIGHVDSAALGVDWGDDELTISVRILLDSEQSLESALAIFEDNKSALFEAFAPEMLDFVLRWVSVSPDNLAELEDGFSAQSVPGIDYPAIEIDLTVNWDELGKHLVSR